MIAAVTPSSVPPVCAALVAASATRTPTPIATMLQFVFVMSPMAPHTKAPTTPAPSPATTPAPRLGCLAGAPIGPFVMEPPVLDRLCRTGLARAGGGRGDSVARRGECSG